MPHDTDQSNLPPVEEVPAAHLAGKQLKNGWRVANIVVRPTGATGGYFSVPYIAKNEDGTDGFLKALNIAKVLQGSNITQALAKFAAEYNFEKDLLEICREKNLSRVIQLLDHGQVEIPKAGVISKVPYLIFELADGDVYNHLEAQRTLDLAWVLRALKHATLGIEQLHSANTAHQDLKPSNLLTQEGGAEIKLGDLGRAERRGILGPTSQRSIPGALAYAPPEQLYGAFDHSWELRRAADIYQLGSLALQFILGHNMQALLLTRLAPKLRPDAYSGTFEEILPYLRLAHATILDLLTKYLKSHSIKEKSANELVRSISEMTDPDPSLRGHPRDRHTKTPYAVRRYVSIFDRLSKQTKLHIANRIGS